MAISKRLSSSQAFAWSSFSCTSPWRSMSFCISSSDMGLAKDSLILLYSCKRSTVCCTPSSTHLTHGLFRIELRLLFENSDGVARRNHDFAHELLVHASHDPEERALARAVQAQDADLGAVEVGKVDVLQHRLLVVKLAHPHHGVDDLVRFSHNCFHDLLKNNRLLCTLIDGGVSIKKAEHLPRRH